MPPFRTLARLLEWHQQQLKTRPGLTNGLTSAFLMLLGDRLAQHFEQRDRKDVGLALHPPAVTATAADNDPTRLRASWTRTLILVSWSGCFNSPFYTWWYRLMNNRFAGRVMVSVLATAFISSPPMNTLFFTYSTALEYAIMRGWGGDPDASLDGLLRAVRTKLETTLLPTLLASVCTWSVVNTLNFKFVPLDYRMLTASTFALCWNTFLSLQQHRHKHEHSTPQAQVQALAARVRRLVGLAEDTDIVAVENAVVDASEQSKSSTEELR